MDSVQKANAGHPGTAMALAPLAYVLYRNVLHHNPANPDWPNRDRFVLSAGHACILQYAALHLTGYNLSLEELKQFRQWGSRTPGHPEHFMTDGRRDDDRPARAGLRERRRLRDRGALPGGALQPASLRRRRSLRIYAICSDGDLMEGVSGGGRVDRRSPRPRPARLLLRRQPHHDRRHDRAQLHHRGQGRSASRHRAGTFSPSRTPRTSPRSSALFAPRTPKRSGRRS